MKKRVNPPYNTVALSKIHSYFVAMFLLTQGILVVIIALTRFACLKDKMRTYPIKKIRRYVHEKFKDKILFIGSGSACHGSMYFMFFIMCQQ